jgi:hypothetical protein
MGDFLGETISNCDSLDMLYAGLEHIKRRIESLEKSRKMDNIYVSIGNVYKDDELAGDLLYCDRYEDKFIVLSKTELEYLKSKFKYRKFDTVEPIIVNDWNRDDDFSLTID